MKLKSTATLIAAAFFIHVFPLIAQAPQNDHAMTNLTVIRLVQSGVPSEVILSTINQSEPHFDLAPLDLIQLKLNNVSDDLVRAMATRQQGATNQEISAKPAPVSASSPTPAPTVAVSSLPEQNKGSHPASTKTIKLRGYVTEIRSQNSFDIDDYRVNRDSTASLDFEKDDDSDSGLSLPDDIRVGTQVEIKGDYDSESHQLTARSIKVFPSETKTVKRTAILEIAPQLQKYGSSWQGSFRADGQLLLVDAQTKLTIVPNGSEKKAEKNAKLAKRVTEVEEAQDSSLTLGKPEDVHANMYVTFEGNREKDGSIRLTKSEFKDNEKTAAERRLWKSLTPRVTAFKSDRPGDLRINGVGRFKTVPNDEVQQYVKKLVNQLVPANQRTLSDADENKITFQPYVIEQKTPNAFAIANGTIVVHSAIIQAVENESQLAFVLGHEMAHATQEHTLRQMEFHKKKRLALKIGAIAASAYGAYNLADVLNLISAAITNGYQRSLENQADRLGMQYMLDAGYDPREAPRAWKAMTLKYGDAPTNFFWSSHDNNATRRTYLMAELRNNYASTDFASTKRDSEEFHRIVQLVAASQTSKSKIKVKY